LSLSDFKVVIIGSGFFGSTVAHQLASVHRIPVLVLEKRDHVGGNSYSRVDPETSIEYHVYGTHIFHTQNETVWKYLAQFTTFNNYRHRVLTTHRGRVYTMPINLMTINQFYGSQLTPAEAKAFIAAEIARDRAAVIDNLEDKAISLIGRPLYEAFVRGYTQKQWDTPLRSLPEDIITRLPVRFNYNDFYFSDPFEGIPSNGYAAIFERMLSNDRIRVVTGCDYFAVADRLAPDALKIYTGPIDGYFRYDIGCLGWRTIDLQLERVKAGDWQGIGVMNYPDLDVGFTRIHEFRHLHPERKYPEDRTLICREYSRRATTSDEPYYPINTPADKALYDRYRARANQEPNVIFGGRLGTYRYLDMHQASAVALKAVPADVLPRLAT
jgi:UDP-galactopyranose mutase